MNRYRSKIQNTRNKLIPNILINHILENIRLAVIKKVKATTKLISKLFIRHYSKDKHWKERKKNSIDFLIFLYFDIYLLQSIDKNLKR